MHQVSADVRRCLETLDVEGFRKLWDHFYPHLPCPSLYYDCLAAMHMARTQAPVFHYKLRFYSHRWLLDNGFPSLLPDRLKPRAERVYPRIVQAVGISCNATSAIMKPVVSHIQHAMEDAVRDCHANGDDLDSKIVKVRMQEARVNTVKKLVGIITEVGFRR